MTVITWRAEYDTTLAQVREHTGKSVKELAAELECSPSLIRKGSQPLHQKLLALLPKSMVAPSSNGAQPAPEPVLSTPVPAPIDEATRLAEHLGTPEGAAARDEVLAFAKTTFGALGAADNVVPNYLVRVRVSMEDAGMFRARRVGWQDRLADTVAQGCFCVAEKYAGSNGVTFYGPAETAPIAKSLFTSLARAAEELSLKDRNVYWAEGFKKNGHRRGLGGFREQWYDTFLADLEHTLKAGGKGATQKRKEVAAAMATVAAAAQAEAAK